jgi:hypothetical protein
MASTFPSITPAVEYGVRDPPLRFGPAGDGKVRHVQVFVCQRTAVPQQKGGESMGRMKEIASSFARVEELAQQILHLSQQRDANKLTCEEYRHVVEEIAWKVFDAVRQY